MCFNVSVPGSFAQCGHGKTDLLDSITAMSISSRDKEAKTRLLFLNTLRNPDSELTAAKSLSPRKRLLKRCFNRLSELEAVEPVSYTSTVKHKNQSLLCGSDFVSFGKLVAIHSPQSEYKSFRTRRSSADCNIPVRRSRLSNVRLEKHETAISLWSRARKRAAKIGSGLARNDKALKLASHHWLEAIDVRHRRGRNLHFYYEEWLNSHTRQPFFCWLDDGEGKALNLVDKCPRSKLEEQCIKYLTPKERKPFEVIVKDGKFLYKQTGKLLHTTEDAKWIFVLSTSKILYVGKKKKGHFHHSSFLAGGATIAAGSLVIESGTLKAVWPHSGHYCPVEENVVEFNKFLRENSIDLADVKMFPVVEGGSSIGHREEETVSDATHEAKGSAWNSSTFRWRIHFNLSKFNLKWLIFTFISFLSITNFIRDLFCPELISFGS